MMCPKHGGEVADMTSPYIVENMLSNTTISVNEVTSITFHLLGLDPILVCERDFLKKYALENVSFFELDTSNDLHIAFYEALVPVCTFCFKDYLKKIGYK